MMLLPLLHPDNKKIKTNRQEKRWQQFARVMQIVGIRGESKINHHRQNTPHRARARTHSLESLIRNQDMQADKGICNCVNKNVPRLESPQEEEGNQVRIEGTARCAVDCSPCNWIN